MTDTDTDPAVPVSQPIELSFPLPHTLNTMVRLHLSIASHHLLLYVTTRTPDAGLAPASVGSFVYALPPRGGSKEPISVAIYVRESTLETAGRIAKALARRTGRPVYVGNSMSFASAGRGGEVQEEMEGVKKVVEVVMREFENSN